MKSWISFLMPDDEYKEKKMLYFLAEGAVLLFLFLVIMIICSNFISLDTGVILLAGIAIFLFYILGRYTLSGIEYTDIATEKEYKRALRALKSRTASFVVLFGIGYLVYTMASNEANWYDFFGMVISVGIISFLLEFISLKKSYKKNKELL
ncbi:hypothetical protein [Oceanobacillus neutriphilus]|uniref:DUF3278 domain-containing protein n=1 Tax=Oceanobacillus neutriphilus TaxID=531815 RepID=A0ABQ2NXT4_9BACI|nr:hypothetical protein [Oceanobacillus neutriphilus]GGP13248.1 hypothetical protein GCM10011346_32500 [Oceanobacillus neutriphilus]